MKAIVHAGQSGLKGLEYKDSTDKQPGAGEVKVRIKAAGLNHRDLFIMADRTEQDIPLIIGSDGTGRIEAVGEGVSNHIVGADVIINPCIGWESTDNVPHVPAIVGGPSEGTFAESIIVPVLGRSGCATSVCLDRLSRSVLEGPPTARGARSYSWHRRWRCDLCHDDGFSGGWTC
jgi:NADPH:quinone reductase-like Zn-dependent oxidoreductase